MQGQGGQQGGQQYRNDDPQGGQQYGQQGGQQGGQQYRNDEAQAMLGQPQQGQGSTRPPPGAQGPPSALTYIHFAASTCVTFGSAYGAFYCLFEEFQPVNVMQFLYLIVFGLGMMLLDVPIGNKLVQDNREHVQTYVHLLTRNVGKGSTFIFVGVMVWVGLLQNNVSVFLPVVLGLFIILVGGVTTALAVRTSWLLNKMRYTMRDPSGMESFRIVFMECASRKDLGLKYMEFNQLSSKFIGISFPEADLKSIFNALSTDMHKLTISEGDFAAWKDGPMVFV